MADIKLCAIFVIWDGEEIFKHAYRCILPLVDDVIIVWSRVSNAGNEGDFDPTRYPGIHVNFEPEPIKQRQINERNKRNAGLREAKRHNFTHFLMMDCDEFYDPNEFLAEKERIVRNNLNGLVCRVKTYIKSPELTVGYDPSTRVPFIHKLHSSIHYCLNRRYPFAYDANGPRIDPTRQLNINNGIEWSDITMHHYSHVRKDIRIKIANSSANLGRSSLLEDWMNAKEGYFCKLYNKPIERCENRFNIEI